MTLAEDIRVSRNEEMRTYLNSMNALYENSIIQNGEIFDIASNLTDQFRGINAEAILADSRIIKIIRYTVAPSISQMKFGQFFKENSIGKYENDRLSTSSKKHKDLSNIAQSIAEFANKNIDKSRFIWLYEDLSSSDQKLAFSYAKKWTCSIASDQNAQTKYRNWRKDQQEHAIATELVNLGYVKSNYTGIVSNYSDINIGEFTTEVRVKGRTRQKSDLVIRSKRSKKLVLIEAKAVGVEIDSTKRIKECCDKSNDWRSSDTLNDPIIVAVIAGFFNDAGIANLQASEINVVWEHNLSKLSGLL